jgi:hypothetical protein
MNIFGSAFSGIPPGPITPGLRFSPGQTGVTATSSITCNAYGQAGRFGCVCRLSIFFQDPDAGVHAARRFRPGSPGRIFANCYGQGATPTLAG